MKILFPSGEATDAEVEEVLRVAIEGRKRVKDQLLRIDSTYPPVRFTYSKADGSEVLVTTLEEEEYPNAYHRRVARESTADDMNPQAVELTAAPATATPSRQPRAVPMAPVATDEQLKEAHLVFQENQRGVSFDKLFGPYLKGASRITVTDPYLRMFHQQRNLMELLETISRQSGPEDEVSVHVLTVEDELNNDRQTENFQKMADACAGIGIHFTWEYDKTGTKHDRDITTDHGWKIVLSRGLDVFQRYELNEAFSFINRLQQHRQCKEFNVTYVRVACPPPCETIRHV
jgi:ATP-dependent Lon protease